MKLLTKIKEFKDKIQCKNFTDDFFDELRERRKVNLKVTLHVMAKYLVDDQLKRTGILYSPYDNYIQIQVQSLFWEWKQEGIINELEDFSNETKSWIMQYA